ncbi:hypothetical protein MKW98_009705 [Papaver atlanticum]|uniref:Uncharacterized protein n=1 Tax=Papaver atlanticum TaxID=357466 RepID=A0AAD4SV94_9MAGN|nr:hypothetical protein MKW98_009705 [Papaver atlanticum]
MAKISMFLSFFLFSLIVMPASSSSRMILQEDQKVVNKCPIFKCVSVCPKPIKVCAQVILKCKFGSYKPCCGCPRCC